MTTPPPSSVPAALKPNSRPSIKLGELYWKLTWPSTVVAEARLPSALTGRDRTRLLPASATKTILLATAPAAGKRKVLEAGCGWLAFGCPEKKSRCPKTLSAAGENAIFSCGKFAKVGY